MVYFARCQQCPPQTVIPRRGGECPSRNAELRAADTQRFAHLPGGDSARAMVLSSQTISQNRQPLSQNAASNLQWRPIWDLPQISTEHRVQCSMSDLMRKVATTRDPEAARKGAQNV